MRVLANSHKNHADSDFTEPGFKAHYSLSRGNRIRTVTGSGRSGMSVNVTWHEENPLPERPCRMVRVLWHARHVLECGCRSVPTSIREDVEAELLRIRNAEAGAFG
jgi:hypothetical protein